MPDDVKDLAKMTAIELARDVYRDSAQPAAKETGKTLSLPFETINTALRPVRTVLLGLNLVFDRLDARLRQKLGETPPEKIVEPPPQVAGPLLLGYGFVEHEPNLRELFEQLLVNAMHADRTALVHPAFVDIVKQLTPAEALIVKLLAQRAQANSLMYPMIELRVTDTNEHYVPGGMLTTLPVEAGVVEDPSKGFDHLDALRRAGVIEFTTNNYMTAPTAYAAFDEAVASIRNRAQTTLGEQNKRLEAQRGVIKLTEIGRRFVAACSPAAP